MIDTYQDHYNINRWIRIITTAILGGGFLAALVGVVYILGSLFEG